MPTDPVDLRNEPEFAALSPGQIVPVLADRGLINGSERSFYRVLHAHSQVQRRGPCTATTGTKTLVTTERRWSKCGVELRHHLPAPTVRGIWLYLHLVIDAWSRKVVAWDVAEREDPAIEADLLSRGA